FVDEDNVVLILQLAKFALAPAPLVVVDFVEVDPARQTLHGHDGPIDPVFPESLLAPVGFELSRTDDQRVDVLFLTPRVLLENAETLVGLAESDGVAEERAPVPVDESDTALN